MITVDVPEIDAASLKVDIQEQKITITAKSPSKEINTELNLWGKVTAEVRFSSNSFSAAFRTYLTLNSLSYCSKWLLTIVSFANPIFSTAVGVQVRRLRQVHRVHHLPR